VVEVGAAAVTAIGDEGTDLIAAVTAVATAVAMSADVGPGAGGGAGAAGPVLDAHVYPVGCRDLCVC